VNEGQTKAMSETPSETNAATSDVPALNGLERIALQDKIIEALRTCYDPEIPVNIYELGLIYEVKVEPSGDVGIRMTLTAPNCPAAASLPLEVEAKVKALPQVTGVKVDVVWEPPWDPSKMSEAARLQLGMF
jgi:FeS assembly SUF system protein